MEDTQHSIHNTCDEAFATLEITQPDKKQKINPQSKVDTGTHSNVLPIRLLCIIPSEKFNNKGNPKPETLDMYVSCPFSIWQLYNQAAWHHKYSLQVQREEDQLHFLCYRPFRASYSRSKSMHCTETSLPTLYTQSKSTRPGLSN